jgi:hypothetical protein
MGVGEYALLFPLIFTMRSIDSKVKLGDRMSKHERARVREQLQGALGDEFTQDSNLGLMQLLQVSEGFGFRV